MADSLDADFSELHQLVADLSGIPARVAPKVRKAIQVTAVHVKKDWSARAKRTGLERYAADITFDLKESRSGVEAEIGPTAGDAGSLGIVEDAPGGVRSEPFHAGRDALRANEEDFIRGIEIAAADIL